MLDGFRNEFSRIEISRILECTHRFLGLRRDRFRFIDDRTTILIALDRTVWIHLIMDIFDIVLTACHFIDEIFAVELSFCDGIRLSDILLCILGNRRFIDSTVWIDLDVLKPEVLEERFSVGREYRGQSIMQGYSLCLTEFNASTFCITIDSRQNLLGTCSDRCSVFRLEVTHDRFCAFICSNNLTEFCRINLLTSSDCLQDFVRCLWTNTFYLEKFFTSCLINIRKTF